MKKILITGASRGIGYELCKQSLEQNHEVFATYRSQSSAKALFDLKQNTRNLRLFEMDVNSDISVQMALKLIADQVENLNTVFNNAGILDWDNLDEISTESFREIYETNVIGAFRVSKASLSLLKNSKDPLIVNLSSRLGSISLRGHSQLGGAIAYQCSKAALNMLTAQMAIDYKHLGVRVVSISPGWVKTDMGGNEAKYEVQESVRLFTSQIEQLAPDKSGIFIGEDGEIIPW
ncbi:MAG: SDR family oxidoreductase [Verrucomicrobiota bacterium]|nr:SDR family oxidoreductase [Verrucomicrobiota bacterium]